MKIAIVLLDDYVTRFGDFGKLGKELLSCVIKGEFTIFNYIIDRVFPDCEEFDLIYLTGSRNDAFAEDLFTNELIKSVSKVLKSNCKLIGICYGHQIVARAIGLKVCRNPLGWEMGKFKVEGELCFTINEMHRDIVINNDKILNESGVKIIGSTEKCLIQGFKSLNGKCKLLTFQGHPEFNNDVTLDMVKLHVIKGDIDESIIKDCELRANFEDFNALKIIAEFVSSV